MSRRKPGPRPRTPQQGELFADPDPSGSGSRKADGEPLASGHSAEGQVTAGPAGRDPMIVREPPAEEVGDGTRAAGRGAHGGGATGMEAVLGGAVDEGAILAALRGAVDDPEFRGRAVDAVGPLIRVLESQVPAVRAEGARLAGKFGPTVAGTMAPRLCELLDDDHRTVRAGAMEALAALGEDAVPALLRVVRRGMPFSQSLAVEVLGRLRRAASWAVPSLAWSLRSAGVRTQVEILRLLERLGRDATMAEGDVRELLRSPWSDVREAAEAALRAMGRR